MAAVLPIARIEEVLRLAEQALHTGYNTCSEAFQSAVLLDGDHFAD